ncbi:ABC transporter ATP-binding protein [Curtobacterium sp. S6]|uniref:ABC transporter ATP-binding protein n=1 Tax=Curtobacterium sp. S6 TaxID=1479623 RepID=UPI0009E9D887|nr:ABC transporter ATP-binding protein [Curtobacterium sp. S6]
MKKQAGGFGRGVLSGRRGRHAAGRGGAQEAASTAGPLLQVQSLQVEFGVDRSWIPAAMDVSYHVNAGEVLALVGESGSGKSVSTMGMLGLLPSNARVTGSVKLRGQELVGLSNRELRQVRGDDVAVIFQEPMTALNPVYSVGDQIVETLRLHRDISPAEAKERALAMLELVELPDPQKAFASFPHQLSGGQRQRAMIAQSLSTDPQLLIADEPTTALDVTVQAEILDLLRNLQQKLHSAIILITHDMGVVADLANRVAVMRRGRIVEMGDVHDVFENPQHDYTKALLSSVLHLGHGEQDHTLDVNAAIEDVARGERPVTEALEKLAPRREGEVVLNLTDVVLEYPRQGRVPAFRAVENVTMSIYEGEVVGLVGESGSGKSTIGRASVGLLDIAAGSLTVGGTELRGAKPSTIRKVRRDVGMVFQDPSSSLNPRLPIGESIGEPLYLAGVAKGAELQRRIADLLDRVQLPHSYRNRFPHELSGGQKQRVGIARALSLSPRLLVADEPTSALDVSVQAKVLELFKDLQKELGFACLFVTHDLAVIDALADHICVMQRGKFVEQGPREQVLRYPREAYTQRLLAAVPLPDPQQQNERRKLRAQLANTSA